MESTTSASLASSEARADDISPSPSLPPLAPEELIRLFRPERVLNQDQAGRRTTLLGAIASKPALLVLERTVFPSSLQDLAALTRALQNVANIGHNDIYAWFLASSPSPSPSVQGRADGASGAGAGAGAGTGEGTETRARTDEEIDIKTGAEPSSSSSSSSSSLPASAATPAPAAAAAAASAGHAPEAVTAPTSSITASAAVSSASASAAAAAALVMPDIKLNLIHPCTEAHVRKYSRQGARVVTETPRVYRERVRPFMRARRGGGRLDWVWNVLEGRAEQEDVLLRVDDPQEGFLVTPDLNWDRKTLSSLHLLAIVQRRDIWSLRDLRKRHVPWLQRMRQRLLEAAVQIYSPDLEQDQIKLYIHYQPTYYHFHIHMVNVALEAGPSQAVGKAFALENVIAQLQSMSDGGNGGGNEGGAGGDGIGHNDDDDDDDNDTSPGMADVDITYTLGEASELWTQVFAPLKRGAMLDK